MGAIISVVLLAVLVVLRYAPWTNGKHNRLPPGPKPLPVLGNVHQVPLEYQQRAFADWTKQYGDVIYAKLFRKPLLILNSAQAAQDLLEKGGAKYSDRPRFILITEMIGFTHNVTILPYGDRWKLQRKWIQTALQTKVALDSYKPIQRRETNRLLHSMLQTPEDHFSHLKRYVGALMMEIAYGHSVTSADDEFINLSEAALAGTVEAGSAAATLVDFFPFLRYIPEWMPGGGFKKRAYEVRKLVQRMIDTPYEKVKEAMVLGTAKPSFLSSLIEEMSKDGDMSPEMRDEVKGAANIVYGAGTDTTATSLKSFVLAMTLFPEACSKAQEEIDRVIGNSRLPEFEDRESLPYVDCLLREVYRWNPPAPLGLPHQLMEDDEYRGYHIPGESMVMANIWAMTRDPNMYFEPDAFRPERFLEMSPADAATRDPYNIVFGFGRRLCAGRQFGDESIWLAVANILAIFSIHKARDVSGKEIEPVISFASGTISHPRPFVCDIRPRSKNAVKLISQINVD
ncbi:cytochrome P450 monooxygenase [Laetiporus sulphureus 93-53]|uniref:Cytochrome P450 monooxygenase n=1 Tax=Laetiporus sulphureus 93-53 TaxID=1314785 RepID=A0A165CPU3_9APHY|nr:cytochrome P450 monooxygenase [Laetiporus sulphureus 93-53]KZT03201.1 cytochrome P450 monooxygenase [Laetiporus sulphureus 93-53]